MTQPTSRTTFKDYCKRKLGHPVVELNIDDDQIEDTIELNNWMSQFSFTIIFKCSSRCRLSHLLSILRNYLIGMLVFI